MIEVNELRIGNWVNRFNCHTKINGVLNDYISFWHDGNEWIWELNNDDTQPIPITSEILEKCGFEKCSNGLEKLCNENYVKIASLFSGFPLTLEIDGNRCPLNIKYAHQLQNLYFALTGEELEINL